MNALLPSETAGPESPASRPGLNILFLTPQLPYPPRQGTAIRNWGLIQHLARHHTVSLLAFQAPDQPPPAAELLSVCLAVRTVPAPRRTHQQRLRTLLTGEADLALRLWSSAFALALRQMLGERRFDVVQIEGLELAGYLPVIREHAPTALIVYDAHNAESVLQRRALAADARALTRWPAAAYSWLQVPRLERLEAAVCGAADAVTCVSEADRAALLQLAPDREALVVPNGLDLVQFTTDADARDPEPPPGVTWATDRIVFTGKMDYRPNIDAAVWFAQDILPLIHARRPQVQFVVVGQQPPPSLLRLADERMVVTGAVEDTRPYIAAGSVYVVPLRMGGGTRFKLLEAMALGRPVVSTTLGAEGFAVRSGQELLLVDSAPDFASAVLSLLEDRARARDLGLAGQAFVRQDFGWESIIPRLEALYAKRGSSSARFE